MCHCWVASALGFSLAIFHFGQAPRLGSQKASMIASPPETGTTRASVGVDGAGDGVGLADGSGLGFEGAAAGFLQPELMRATASAAARMDGFMRNGVQYGIG
jgi:hypothetical protein